MHSRVFLAIGAWLLGASAATCGSLVAVSLIGQSIGGPFWIGNATDVNSGPLLVLLAATVWRVPSPATRTVKAKDRGPASELSVGAA